MNDSTETAEAKAEGEGRKAEVSASTTPDAEQANTPSELAVAAPVKPAVDAPLDAQVSSGAQTATDAPQVAPADMKAASVQVERNGRVAARVQSEWRVIGETVPGASHIRGGIPNQDAILHVRQSSVRLPIIVAVADGHGSDKCFRSDRGSHFAVRIGCELLDEIINSERARLDAVELEAKVHDSLPAEFVRRWRASVEADMQREPLKEAEFTRLIEKDGVGARHTVEANPFLAYGSTALACLLTESFALFLQLGDGEILIVTEQGEVAQPLPADARLMANETTSLCLEKAAQDFRFVVRPHGETPPALILMTTDGYANSFSTTAGFHQVGSDLLAMLREEGFDAINRNVKSWLEEATKEGSGDDSTLAIIVCMDALKADNPAAVTSPTTATAPSPPSTATAASSPLPPPADSVSGVAPANSHEQPAAPKTA